MKKYSLVSKIFIFLGVFLLCSIRPIHQDDGWYFSYFLRFLDHFSLINETSYFNFSDLNNGNNQLVNFSFYLLSTPFLLIFGVNLASVKIYNALIIYFIVTNFYNLLKNLNITHSKLITFLLIINPVFYYHFYNRPEILSILLSLISLRLLTQHKQKDVYVFLSFFLWAFILDSHPIGIFFILGAGIYFTFKNFKKYIVHIFLGGFSGLCLTIGLNYFFNDNFGIFYYVFTGNNNLIGDHYIPLFTSDFNDFFRIFNERLKSLRLTIVLSGLIFVIPFILYRKYYFNFNQKIIIYNSILFIIFVTLFSEASSNGFALYSLLILFTVYSIFIDAFLTKIKSKKYSYLIFLPLLFISLFRTTTTAHKYYNYYNYFNNTYYEFCNVFENNSKILMRPTFSFATSLNRLNVDYPFGILNYMKKNDLTFEEAVDTKKYDYLVLDDQFLNDELFIDKRTKLGDSNLSYKSLNDIGLFSFEFQNLINSNFLELIDTFDEISHGKTYIYKVNKE